ELCRQRMAVKTSDRPEPLHTSRINSVSSQFSDGPMPSPSTRSSTSSWCEEPVQSNMDISTGHMILSYMEDHLKNKNRLEKEWEALCAYQAEPNATTIALKEENRKKNRSEKVVACEYFSEMFSKYFIACHAKMDHDPRNPAYISTQGPLPATVADFWQVNLVSEHIWCEDFLVRSFYLKNLQTNETRTVTQFHFLTWLNKSVPESARTLLDFRSWDTIGLPAWSSPAERPVSGGQVPDDVVLSARRGFGPVEKGKRGPEALPGHSPRRPAGLRTRSGPAPFRQPLTCLLKSSVAGSMPVRSLSAHRSHRQLAQPPRGFPLPAQRMALLRTRTPSAASSPIGGTGTHPSVPPSSLGCPDGLGLSTAKAQIQPVCVQAERQETAAGLKRRALGPRALSSPDPTSSCVFDLPALLAVCTAASAVGKLPTGAGRPVSGHGHVRRTPTCFTGTATLTTPAVFCRPPVPAPRRSSVSRGVSPGATLSRQLLTLAARTLSKSSKGGLAGEGFLRHAEPLVERETDVGELTCPSAPRDACLLWATPSGPIGSRFGTRLVFVGPASIQSSAGTPDTPANPVPVSGRDIRAAAILPSLLRVQRRASSPRCGCSGFLNRSGSVCSLLCCRRRALPTARGPACTCHGRDPVRPSL
ncbi:PTPR2 phosphatase, partial [Polypterus senegalus]